MGRRTRTLRWPRRHRIPIGGAEGNHVRLRVPILDAVARPGSHLYIGTLHLDRSLGSGAVTGRVAVAGIIDADLRGGGTKVPE
jgi:hypothetical protein